jgi:hypothetical protein
MNGQTGATLSVAPVGMAECREWLTRKHYLRRATSFTYAYGLYDGPVLVGVCTFGNAVPVQMKKSLCGAEFAHLVYELNRLCTNDDLPRNAESFFLGQCFKLLPKPLIVVSYADASVGHIGYIYQATNFHYTGISHIQKDWKLRGSEHLHSRTLMDEFAFTEDRVNKLKEKYGDRLYQVERPAKHRYVKFLGDRRDRRRLEAAKLFRPQPYPKGISEHTDASYSPLTQLRLL